MQISSRPNTPPPPPVGEQQLSGAQGKETDSKATQTPPALPHPHEAIQHERTIPGLKRSASSPAAEGIPPHKIQRPEQQEKAHETGTTSASQDSATDAKNSGDAPKRTGSADAGSVSRNYRSVDGSWDSAGSDRGQIEEINRLRAGVTEAKLKERGALVRIFSGAGFKSRIFEINDPVLYRSLLRAIKQDLFADKPIGKDGLGGNSVILRSPENYAAPTRLFVAENGVAIGSVAEGGVIKSVGASPYFKGNFSSLFRALRASGGEFLDAHFGDATPEIYLHFGMHPGAICWQDLRVMRPDWDPIDALKEFPNGTRLLDPQGNRVELEFDRNEKGEVTNVKLPEAALDEEGKIRIDWKVVNPRLAMYAKEGDKYSGKLTDDVLARLPTAPTLEEAYDITRGLHADHQAALARQRAANAELEAA